MPRNLAVLDAEGGVTAYRLRLRWNGRYQLQLAALLIAPHQPVPSIVVIDRTLPYRRKLQQLPEAQKSRLAMLRTAPDEFPLAPADMLYALGANGHDGYLYALPRQYLDPLQQHSLHPAIVLVANQGTDAGGSLEALESYLRNGASVDFLRTGFFLSRRRLLQILLGSFLAVTLLAGSWLIAHPDLFAGILEWRVAALREQGSTLPKLYRITEKMAYAQSEAARLYATPEARLPGILAKLFATVPAGCSLRTVELKDGILKIAGTGNEASEWLTAQGFPPDRITVENLGQQKRFRAERPL
jgi:hypothetical protein